MPAVDARADAEEYRRLKEEYRDRDLLASCPGCATFETLNFRGGSLVQWRKFSQRDGRVYHDCGTDKPCMLFPIWEVT